MSTALKLTIDEYDRMIDYDVFDKSRTNRIELIEGRLYETPRYEPAHEYINSLLSEWSLLSSPRDSVWIRNQNSIGIPPFTVPRPDIAWVVKKSYRHHRPLPDDVLLVIEVSENLLGEVQLIKGPLYAAAGIPEYWIVNIPGNCIEVHRKPANGTYHDIRSYGVGETVRPLAFPDVELPVETLFLWMTPAVSRHLCKISFPARVSRSR